MKFNSLTIIGHLGRDPEMKYTPSGHAVTTFSVAVNAGRGDDQTTEWFQVQAWGKLGESCNQYLTKGSPVLVQGPVTLNKWTGKDNLEKSQMRVTAREVAFLGSKSDSQDGGEPSGGGQRATGSLVPNTDDSANMPF